MRTIRVADMYIAISCADEAFFAPRLDKYACEPQEVPDLVLKTQLCEKIEEPCGTLVTTQKDTHVIWDGKRYCRYLKTKQGGVPLAVWYTSDHREAEIFIRRDFYMDEMTPTAWEYLYTGWCFQNRLSVLGGVVLHSSAICFRGKGIAFSANPGIGKSTHVSQWKEKFGDEVQIVNDDKPAIRYVDGEFWLYGTPWSGKTKLHENVKCRLSAIFFVARAQDNWVEKMDMMETVFYLSKQLPTPFYDKTITERTLEFINKLCEQEIPVCRLHCNISEKAVEAVYDEVFMKNSKELR